MSNFEYEHLLHPQLEELHIRDLMQQTFTDSEGEEEGQSIGLLTHKLITQTPPNDICVFVATDKDDPATTIVGCVIFTRLKFNDHPDINAVLLSPVAVHTAHQGKGIGRGLVRFGIEAFRSTRSADIVVTYGDPKFHSKVGFHQVSAEMIPAPVSLTQPHGWQAQSLLGRRIKRITGHSTCVSALNSPKYW